MAFLSSLLITAPSGVWPTIINAFEAVGNYAWAIILLTICIKLVMSPLDFFNKKISRKNAQIQAVLAPEMAKIQKQYGHDKNLYNQKLNELYKKNNFNIFGSCIFMLVNFVLIIVIFFTLWNSLNSMANYKIADQYNQLETVYYQTYDQTSGTDEEKVSAANQAVVVKYDEIKDSWLWIENVWVSETPWTNSIPDFNAYLSMIGNKVDILNTETGEMESVNFSDLTETEQTEIKNRYNTVMNPLRESTGRANGYLILVILAVGTAFLSQFLNAYRVGKKTKSRNGDSPKSQASNKIVMIILPIIMGIFTLFYNSIFALYIITSQLISIITTPLIDLILDKVEARAEKKKEAKVVVDYSRKK